MALYKIFNGPMPTTASQLAVTTGTNIKTMLQVKPGATQFARVVEWGVSMDGSALATPVEWELCETDVAATVTASVAADFTKYDEAALAQGDPTTNLFSVGTSATGYTASAEGTITVVRQGDVQLVQPSGQWVFQFQPGYRFVLQPGKFGRIRVKAGSAINAICYMLLEV